MKVEQGTSRIALIVSNIVFKFAKPLFCFGVMENRRFLVVYLCGIAIRIPEKRGHPTISRYLFIGVGGGGIKSNLSEYSFYCKNKSFFVAPTYFSFFGFVNICKKADTDSVRKMAIDSKRDKHVVLDQIQKIIGSKFRDCLPGLTIDEIWDMGHHLHTLRNYGKINDKLVLVDYPGFIVQELIRRYGEKISREFKFPAPKVEQDRS